MIQSVWFRNFRALRDLRLDLERLTVFAGANGSGKSSILLGIGSLLRLKGEVPGAPDLTVRSESSKGDWPKARLLRLEPRLLAESSGPGESGRLVSDGQGFAWDLAELSVQAPERFERVKANLKELFPWVENVRVERPQAGDGGGSAENNGVSGERIAVDVVGATLVGGSVGDGVLLALGILAAIHGGEGERVVMIDDLDRGLHPVTQQTLVERLRRAVESDPGLQVLATTYSPYLLNAFNPAEVRVTTRRMDGTVSCAPLSEHPDFEHWKGHMSPGEFWSYVGEEWVAARCLAEAVA